MKLLIAIPTHDYLHYEFMSSLIRLVEKLKDDHVDYEVAIQGGTLVYVGRDKLAYKAIDEGFTHVLWLDADMVFTEDILDDLLFAGKSFVSAIYHGRREPHLSCLFDQIYPEIVRYTTYPSNTFKIAGCGFGCVLIATDIMKAVRLKFGTCFFPTRELGEDLAFCQRVTECGYEMYAEPIKLGHIGHIKVYPEYRDAYKSVIQGFMGLEDARKD